MSITRFRTELASVGSIYLAAIIPHHEHSSIDYHAFFNWLPHLLQLTTTPSSIDYHAFFNWLPRLLQVAGDDQHHKLRNSSGSMWIQLANWSTIAKKANDSQITLLTGCEVARSEGFNCSGNRDRAWRTLHSGHDSPPDTKSKSRKMR
jgi:hypothetical protein